MEQQKTLDGVRYGLSSSTKQNTNIPEQTDPLLPCLELVGSNLLCKLNVSCLGRSYLVVLGIITVLIMVCMRGLARNESEQNRK